jgi:putative Holliday junction resolvase
MPGTPEDSALAFDVGTRVIGVAIGNRLSGSARALTTLAPDDWARLDALVAEWRPDALVVGLPLTLDGAEQPMSRRARAFATQLEQRYQRPTHLVDERNTSREAARRFAQQRASGAAKRKDAAAIDALAAAIILDAWL